MKKFLLILSVFISSFSFAQSYHYDSVNLSLQNQYWGFPDSLQGFGHSIMFGTNGDAVTVLDSAFFYLFSRNIRDSGFDHGIGGTGAIDAYMQGLRYITNPHKAMVMILSGRNEFVGTTNAGTYNKVVNADKATIANSLLKNFASARTASTLYVNKFGTWANYTNLAGSGYTETKTREGTQTTTINDSITYDFIYPDSTLVVGLIGLNTGGAAPQVFIDGVSQGTFSTNGVNDAQNHDINLTAGTRCPVVFFFTGLSYAKHHVKVVNTTSATLVVDYFGHLIDSRYSMPLVIMHDIAYGATGSGGVASDSLVHLNTKIDSMLTAVTAQLPGYHIVAFPTNTYWTQGTDVGVDGIHPNNTGFRHLFNGLINFAKTYWIRPHMGTIVNLPGGPHIRTQQDTSFFSLRRIATMGDISTQYLPLNYKWPQVITTNKFNTTFTGVGATGANGAGAYVIAPDLAINDSSFTYFKVQPSGETSTTMGIQGRDWTGATYSLGIGSNVATFLPSINSNRQGGGFFFDSRTASGNPVSIVIVTKPPTVTTDVNAGRIFADGRWTLGDTAAAGNAPYYLVGTSAMRLPSGTVAQRPTGQLGNFRVETDSLGRLEVNSNGAHKVVAFLQDEWGITTVADANLTTQQGIPQYILPAITAGRTVTIATAERPGEIKEFMVTNTSGNAWTFATTVKDLSGGTVTALPNGTTTRLVWDGSQWFKK